MIKKNVMTFLGCVTLAVLPMLAMANDTQADVVHNNVVAGDVDVEAGDALAMLAMNMADEWMDIEPSNQQAVGLIANAKNYIGTPYRAGGASPSGFDCSGFMQYIFKSVNINLPRTSRDMSVVGVKVAREQLQEGDMVFFAHSGSRISHVGMYVGDDKFIHSPSTGKTVEIVSLNSKYWSPRFVTARRVLA